MGRTGQEYKFAELSGLNTFIDKFGLTKGEMYEANNVFLKKYGKKLIAKGRPGLATESGTLKSVDTISLGYGNLPVYDNANDTDSPTRLFLHDEDGELNTFKMGSQISTNGVLTNLPTIANSVRNTSKTLTFTNLNGYIYLTSPKVPRDIQHCEEVTTFTAYGAEAGVRALDNTEFTEGSGSIKTTITDSNATENGLYYTVGFYTNHAVHLDVYLSDVSSIANIRVRLYKDLTDTDGRYWDFTFQNGGQDLISGWNSISVNIDDGTGTVIGAGLGTGVTSGRLKIGAITSANSTYQLNIDNIIFGNQTIGLHSSTDGLAWNKSYLSSKILPPFSRITVWDGRVFGIYKNRVYFSNINDGTDFWNASDTEDKAGATNTNTTVNGLASTKNLKIGLRVTDSAGDIPDDTVITSIDSAIAITISQAATGSTAANTITFKGTVDDSANYYEYDDGDGDILTALSSLGKKTLILFKNNSIHRVKINTAQDNYTIPYTRESVFSTKEQVGIGCKVPDTVQHILVQGVQQEVWGAAEYLVFAGRNNIYAIGSIGGPISLSDGIDEMGAFLNYQYYSTDQTRLFSVIYVEENAYIIMSALQHKGYVYNIQAKEWSTITITPPKVATTEKYITAAVNLPLVKVVDPALNWPDGSVCCFGQVDHGDVLFLSYDQSNNIDRFTSAITSTYISTIKFGMYSYGREQFYKTLLDTASVLSTVGSGNLDITVENEEGSTASKTISPTTTPGYYQFMPKLYGTHFSQQYTLTGRGILHRFVHEIKHTNNKKG